MLAKRPQLHGKAPVAALYAEEYAEIAENIESEEDDDMDEGYVDAEDVVENDNAEYVEATTPP
ncbi:hypothetical protein PHMEG_0004060 [Phytophthora megakarya]|uniref:Uncharacterized protein n=1 Tax=Phytophthora megakarya TaxID=4795 RepID=A0A225WWE3_9STRA|nr:hypothetical protein PHMEG_0004060 [Phytophthora megakarya]